LFNPCPDRQDRLVVKDRRDRRDLRERQERQEAVVLRARLVGVDLEAERLNDPRHVRGASTSRGTAVALTIEREVPEEAIRTMKTTTTP